uniref:Plant bHLH transcription factor ACT-like domain-containing protein n=1 Tax=Lactuca sativa TaxID=4236 RepID=A0A9R1WW42_LACSA|nr:hypothetical protein LSAT_V11C900496950 [Lactuca sativa]
MSTNLQIQVIQGPLRLKLLKEVKVLNCFYLKVSYVGEKIALVSLKCRKRRDMMVKICEVFESLKLNVVIANITAFPETLFNTLFIQVCNRKHTLRWCVLD